MVSKDERIKELEELNEKLKMEIEEASIANRDSSIEREKETKSLKDEVIKAKALARKNFVHEKKLRDERLKRCERERDELLETVSSLVIANKTLQV